MKSYSTLDIDIPPKRVFGWLGNDYDPSWVDSLPDRTDGPFPNGNLMICHPKNYKRFYDEAKRGGDMFFNEKPSVEPTCLEDIFLRELRLSRT